MWIFFKDDTELYCDTKKIQQLQSQKIFHNVFNDWSSKTTPSTTKSLSKSTSVLSQLYLLYLFCITIKFSIIFEEYSKNLLNKIRGTFQCGPLELRYPPLWTSQVEVPSNVDTAHIARDLATLEGTSGTLQVCHCARPLNQPNLFC